MPAARPLLGLLCHNSLPPTPTPPRPGSRALSLRENSTQRGNKGLELMDVNEFSRIRLSGGECNLLVNTGP